MFVSPPLLLHIYQNIKAVMSVFSRAPGAPHRGHQHPMSGTRGVIPRDDICGDPAWFIHNLRKTKIHQDDGMTALLCRACGWLECPGCAQS